MKTKMHKILSYILLPRNVVVTIDGKTYTISKGNPGFEKIQMAVKQQNLTKITVLLNKYGYLEQAIKKVINQVAPGANFSFNGNVLSFNGYQFDNSFTKLFAKFINEGQDISGFKLLMEKIIA